MTNKLHIQRVKISNILGIESLEFEPKQFTRISGKNGQGKTSVLEAIKAGLQGGNDATLIRAGQPEGEIVLELSDGRQIERKYKPTTNAQHIRDENGKRMDKPGTIISGLVDMVSINPVAFLRSNGKDRTDILLQSMPIKADGAKLDEICNGLLGEIDASGHALEVFTRVQKAVYDQRTGVNRTGKDKKATVDQLKSTIADTPDAVDGDEMERLQMTIDQAEERKDDGIAEVETKLDGYQKQHDERMEELRKAMDEERERFANIKSAAAGKKQQIRESIDNETAEAKQKLLELRNAQQQIGQQQQVRDMIEQHESELEKLRTESEKLTDILKKLVDYKDQLLAELPIKGISVVDGELYREGVHFDRLNTAQQVMIAIEIAKQRAGELGVVCLDGIELMDSDTLEEFQKQASESGLQMFVTEVTDDDIEIE